MLAQRNELRDGGPNSHAPGGGKAGNEEEHGEQFCEASDGGVVVQSACAHCGIIVHTRPHTCPQRWVMPHTSTPAKTFVLFFLSSKSSPHDRRARTAIVNDIPKAPAERMTRRPTCTVNTGSQPARDAAGSAWDAAGSLHARDPNMFRVMRDQDLLGMRRDRYFHLLISERSAG